MNKLNGNRSSHAGESDEAPARGAANLPRRILVVDDDLAVRQSSADVLISSGYHVDAAEDGAAGWEALHANSYDLLITDHGMPKVTGVELVKKLRSARMALPVILASGAIPTEELDRHPWLQLAATLLKPFTGEELLGAVNLVLRAVHDSSGAAHAAALLREPAIQCT